MSFFKDSIKNSWSLAVFVVELNSDNLIICSRLFLVNINFCITRSKPRTSDSIVIPDNKGRNIVLVST